MGLAAKHLVEETMASASRMSGCPRYRIRSAARGGGSLRRAILCQVVPALVFLVFLAPSAAQEGPPPARVVTDRVKAETLNQEVELLGTVRAVVDSLVAAEIEGRVSERLVENGDRVRKSEPMVRLDPARLEKDLAQAKAEKIEILSRLDLARRQEVRARDLREKNVLAEDLFDQRISQRRVLEGSRDKINARIASIEEDIERTIIRAPFSGSVTEIHTEVGEWLARGLPVVRLADLSTVEIRIDVPERYYPHLTKGTATPIAIDALPGAGLKGKIFSLVPQADEEAHTFPVLVRASNPGRRVSAGMLARVGLSLQSGERVLLVPKDAIVRQAQQNVVYIVQEEQVRAVTVRTGRSNGERVEVEGDLKADDLVVIRGNERLIPGQKVLIEESVADGR